jgi:hypothetical protein
MSIIGKIGPDTISRLARAAERRCSEADWLAEGKHRLAAIYFFGYVAEIVLGTAYFKMRGYKSTDPILRGDLDRTLKLARSRSRMPEKTHPVDGWALLLIEEKAQLYPPAYEKRMERLLRDRALLISENWSPKFRYRAIEIGEDQVTPVRNAAHWLLENSHRL